jgi:hypothetical protein
MDSNQYSPDVADRLAITQVIHDWVFYRDNGKFEALRTLFSKSGRMTTNSASHSADEFVAYGRALRERGFLSHHIPGPSQIRINGDKALVETQATLMFRTKIGDVVADIWVLLRYLDRFVRELGAWKIEERQPIYIKDRLDPVVPGTAIAIDHSLLEECPPGCRYLIYASRAAGAPRSTTEAVTFNTPRADAIYAAGDEWLAA